MAGDVTVNFGEACSKTDVTSIKFQSLSIVCMYAGRMFNISMSIPKVYNYRARNLSSAKIPLAK